MSFKHKTALFQKCITYDGWNTLHNSCPDFPPILNWPIWVDRFTFTFMHLADAFIQSDLQCIQVIHLLSVCVPWELNPQPLLLTQCSTTELQEQRFNRFNRTSRSVWWLQIFLASDYGSIQSEDIKDFGTDIVFICHASPSNKAHVSAWVCCDRNNSNV